MRNSDVEPLDNTTDVETPECIRFRHQVAGPVRRALAYLVDLVLRLIVVSAVGVLAVGASGLSSGAGKASAGLTLLVMFVLEWGWNVLFETFWRGRTPGKRILGLRVVREGGYPVGFIDSMLRNVMRAADFLPVGYVLGVLAMAGDRRSRRLGDRVAGTMVVIESPAVSPPPLVLTPPATTDELGALPHRPPLSADEADAIQLFLRRPHLSNERRTELAEMVAPALAARMHVTPTDPVRFLALVYQRALGARQAAAAVAAAVRPGSGQGTR